MDALAAVGLVGNIVQFIDFANKLVSKTKEGYQSADGALVENADLKTVTIDLLALAEDIKPISGIGNSITLHSLCLRCTDIANELLKALAKLTIQDGKSKWTSFRKALRSVWSKEEILGIEKRLSSFRDEISLHIVVDLREQINKAGTKQSGEYELLASKTREILELIINGQDVFKRETEVQTNDIRAMHIQTDDIIVQQHVNTRVEVIEAIHVSDQHGDAEHEATRQEISQLKDAIEELSKQMKQKDNELKDILEEFRNTRSQNKKKKLQERGNAVSAALLAFEVMYRSLISILKSLQEHAKRALQPSTFKYTWRVTAYPRNDTPTTQSESQVELVKWYNPRNPSYPNTTPSAALPDPNLAINHARNLYSRCYFRILDLRDDLVDVNALVRQWPALQDSEVFDQELFTNAQGLVPVFLPEVPAIWIMAILISAMSAWPFPVDDHAKDRIIHEILVEVLCSASSSRDHVRIEGYLRSNLRSDIKIWELFAEARGLRLAIDSRFRNSKLLSRNEFARDGASPDPAGRTAHVDEWTRFLTWLLIPEPSRGEEDGQLRVCGPILAIAILLKDIGYVFGINARDWRRLWGDTAKCHDSVTANFSSNPRFSERNHEQTKEVLSATSDALDLSCAPSFGVLDSLDHWLGEISRSKK